MYSTQRTNMSNMSKLHVPCICVSRDTKDGQGASILPLPRPALWPSPPSPPASLSLNPRAETWAAPARCMLTSCSGDPRSSQQHHLLFLAHSRCPQKAKVKGSPSQLAQREGLKVCITTKMVLLEMVRRVTLTSRSVPSHPTARAGGWHAGAEAHGVITDLEEGWITSQRCGWETKMCLSLQSSGELQVLGSSWARRRHLHGRHGEEKPGRGAASAVPRNIPAGCKPGLHLSAPDV